MLPQLPAFHPNVERRLALLETSPALDFPPGQQPGTRSWHLSGVRLPPPTSREETIPFSVSTPRHLDGKTRHLGREPRQLDLRSRHRGGKTRHLERVPRHLGGDTRHLGRELPHSDYLRGVCS